MGIPTDNTPLSPQQAEFCQLYHKFNVGYKAYLTAYPSSKKWERASVDTAASHLLSLNKIKTRIAELKAVTLKQTQLTVQGQVKKLDRITEFDPAQLVDEDGFPVPVQELPEDVRKAIQELKVRVIPGKNGNGDIVEHIYKIPSRVAAIDQENKHLGFYEADNAQKAVEIKVLQQFIAIFEPATQAQLWTVCQERFGLSPAGVEHDSKSAPT